MTTSNSPAPSPEVSELGRLVAGLQVDPATLANDTRELAGQDADDEWGNSCLVMLRYDPRTGRAALCPKSWQRHQLDGAPVGTHEVLAKSLQVAGALAGPAFDLGSLAAGDEAWIEHAAAGGELRFWLGEALAKSVASSDDSSAGPSERWITVHPNGDDSKGVPIKIKLNNDKSWSVAGGAGGKLNGLRLTHVKSHAEYKQAAAEKAEKKKAEKKEAHAKNLESLTNKHRADVLDEAKAAGKTPSGDEVEIEAKTRAELEAKGQAKEKGEAVDEAKKKKRDGEEALIAHVGEMQGWAADAIKIPDAALDDFRKKKARELVDNDPQLKKLMMSGDPEAVEEARTKVAERVEKVVDKLKDKHHRLALKRAKQVLSNLKELVVTAAEDVNAKSMGDVKISDLVKDTLGDSGKGYVANLREEAEARGMVMPEAQQTADAQNWQSTLERKGMDLDAAAAASAYVEKLQAGAAAMRQEVAKAAQTLGEAGHGPLGAVQSLEAAPKTRDVGEAVGALAKARQLEAAITGAAEEAKAIEGADPGANPKAAAVVEGQEITHADALAQVLEELDRDPAESKRQVAMGDLLDCYNAQDQVSPLVSHRLNGHGGFFNGVAQAAGVRGPDPLAADILGPSLTAHVMRRAIEMAAGGDKARVEGARAALEEHHIAKQVELATAATDAAKELLNKADNIADFPLDSDDALAAAVVQAKQKNDLTREARTHLGVALGRLEAGAALNEAFMSPNKPLQVNLGALGMADAVTRAGALGLTEADKYDPTSGDLLASGHYSIFNDGENKILTINPAGLDVLAGALQESPSHLARVATAAAIKGGQHDEADWLPKGFARRPAVDVSGGDGLNIARHDIELNMSGPDGTPHQDAAGIAGALRENIAKRIEAGHSFEAIGSALRSEAFIGAHVPDGLREAYQAAVGEVAPLHQHVKDGPPDQALKHANALREKFAGYHSDWVQGEVAAGRLDGEHASIHSQVLPTDQKTHDLVHQAVMQDPRLQYAFHDVGALDAEGRRAAREYAYEHLLKDDQGNPLGSSKANSDQPTQALSPQEAAAWKHWGELKAEVGGAKKEIYGELQKRVAEKLDAGESGGMMSMFDMGPSEPHKLTQVDLHDDAAVIDAAREHAAELGYEDQLDPEAAKRGEIVRSYPGLDVGADGASHADIAQNARNRVRGWLRHKYFTDVLGHSDLAMGNDNGRPTPNSTFNPDNVHTGSERWAGYVAGLGASGKEAERRAYGSVLEKMKGDFNQRFTKGFEQLHGKPLLSTAVPLTHADAHAVAVLPPSKRAEAKASREAAGRAERAGQQNRAGGKFAEDNLAEKTEAAKANAGMDARLLPKQDVQDSEIEGVHRLSIGGAAEATVRGLMPRINARKGTVASANTDMSSAVGVKRQRAIKQLEAMGRVGLTLGVGTGKTAISLGAFSHLRAQGKAKRALMAVPSVVQEQFGSEAMRFYDLTDPNHPKWHAKAGAPPEERRAAYHHESGHDVCVVTHQALRDDLNWALAQHKFAGDEDQAAKYLETAPEVDRNAAMKEAMDAHGWHFDMSVVDEGHNLLNRAGKENSGMANAIDAFTSSKPYHASMSADPVKNDASEAHDFLRKVAPHRYVNDDHPEAGTPETVSRSEFLRKYGMKSDAALEALQKEMEPYQYAEAVKPDTELTSQFHHVDMTPPQHEEYKAVHKSFQKARAARKRGGVDVEAVKHLSPNSFEGMAESEHEGIAERLSGSLGMLRDSALDRVVNYHPQGAKFDWLDQRLGLKPSAGGMDAKPHEEHCPIIFAHNLEAVNRIEEHLAKQGIKTSRIDGTMSGQEKEKQKTAFSPQWDAKAGKYVSEPTSTVMISTDAGAVGWNGQRSAHVIHWDCPHTAMLHEQRTGRAYRTGQRRDVHTDTVLTNTPYELNRRKRLERKGAMRDALTTPAELIDDSGLSQQIATQTDNARERLLTNSVDAHHDTNARLDASLSAPAKPTAAPAAAPAPDQAAADQDAPDDDAARARAEAAMKMPAGDYEHPDNRVLRDVHGVTQLDNKIAKARADGDDATADGLRPARDAAHAKYEAAKAEKDAQRAAPDQAAPAP